MATAKELEAQVRANCLARGCTCGDRAGMVLTAPMADTDFTVVIEHLEECPLYRDPAQLGEVLARGEPDARTTLG